MEKTILSYGDELKSPRESFTYQVIGPICRLYDREELPYPSCSLVYRGKQPSWKRVGNRFVCDVATKRSPSYSVELLGDYSDIEKLTDHSPKVITLYYLKLPPSLQEWWVTPSCKLKHYSSN